MQKITPFLWFDTQAEEAARFYTSIFKNSKIDTIATYDEAGSKASGMKKGSVMVVDFTLEGQHFSALNGGPIFKFTPAISLVVNCDTQKELDHIWDSLSANPAAEQCGWLVDKYGVSWQIVPTIMNKLMTDPDPVKSGRVMKAMIAMKKLDIAALKAAYAGK